MSLISSVLVRKAGFEPIFIPNKVSVVTDYSNILGERGLIGAGRIGQTNEFPTEAINAFHELKLEANETPISLAMREPENDRFNFGNQSVDRTVTELDAGSDRLFG